MMKISGLDKLAKEMTDAKKALESLDGDLGTVSFNANDPASIDSAIRKIEEIIDERVGQYANNSIIGPLAEQMKDGYREAIIERAAEERLKDTE